jgi:ribonuclease P protein component
VDESASGEPFADRPRAGDEAVSGQWLGTVVPKRHARRAATRNLLKRQIRAVMLAESPRLPPGLWVVRLRAPFDRQQFKSAASAPLRALARSELTTMLQRAASCPIAAGAR